MTARPTADDIIPVSAARTRGAFSEPVPASEFRAALTGMTTAVSIIATNGPARMAGLTCSAVCGVSDTPATLVACVSRLRKPRHRPNLSSISGNNTQPRGPYEHQQADAKLRYPQGRSHGAAHRAALSRCAR
jgi:hypothetical protein